MLKICSNNHLRDEMVDQKKDSSNSKSQTVEKIDEAIAPAQKRQTRENSRMPIAGRPDINEISKRNEEAARQERKSFYIITGKIALLVIVVIFLVYFLAK